MHVLSGLFYWGKSKHHAEYRDYYRRTGIYIPAVGPHGEGTGRDGSQVRDNTVIRNGAETVLNQTNAKVLAVLFAHVHFNPVVYLSRHRIDSTVEDTQLNVDLAHSEILKYFQSVSNNRWLLIKIFLILIIFFFIFVVFLAWTLWMTWQFRTEWLLRSLSWKNGTSRKLTCKIKQGSFDFGVTRCNTVEHLQNPHLVDHEQCYLIVY